MVGRYGIHLATDDAIAATALPDASGDSDSAWMLNKDYFYRRDDLDVEKEYTDVRVKRKLYSSKMSIYFMLESVNGALTYGFGARVLFSWK